MLINYKDDIQFFTEFPCLLEHPVHKCAVQGYPQRMRAEKRAKTQLFKYYYSKIKLNLE